MPGGASKLRDVRKLSDAAAILDLDIPVAELRGLSVEPLVGGGPVHAHLQFGREQGYMVAKVALAGQVELVTRATSTSVDVALTDILALVKERVEEELLLETSC